MSEIWIANASPIIALAKIERLDFIVVESRTLLLPEAVAVEILQAPAHDAARQALEAGWGPKPVAVAPDIGVLEWGLGAGETAVLSLARQQKAMAILDDKAARIACRALGIPLIGTLGVVLRAQREGRISSSVEVLKALKGAGLYLDNKVIRVALEKTTGERWPE